MLEINTGSQVNITLGENYIEGESYWNLVTEYYQQMFLVREIHINIDVLFQFVYCPSKLSEIAAI